MALADLLFILDGLRQDLRAHRRHHQQGNQPAAMHRTSPEQLAAVEGRASRTFKNAAERREDQWLASAKVPRFT
jgi:predicted GIY-YIG superfamily endonuclease